MSYDIITHNKTMPYKVSVIVPVYNVEDYLEDTLSSIIGQTLEGIEVIVIDDGSSDNSDNIIRSFIEKNNTIVYVKQKNKGPGQARNVGIELAKGHFISFVDSDDMLPRHALEVMYKAALQEQAEVVTGASLSFNSKRSWYIQSHLDKGVYKPGLKTITLNPEMLYSLGPCNKLFKTSLIKDMRFPKHIKVTEDHPFVIEAYLRANKIFTVDDIIYKYRRRETPTNASLSQRVTVNSLSVLNDIMNSMKRSDRLWNTYLSNKYVIEDIKAYYYNRLLWADIWPIIKIVLQSREAQVQFETLQILGRWLEEFTPSFFNKVTALHHIFTYELVLRFTMLAKKVHPLYLKIIALCFNLMDPVTEQRLKAIKFTKEVQVAKRASIKQNVFPITVYVFRSRVKKARLLANRVLRNGLSRRFLYPLFKMLPIRKKIVFASNKMAHLSDSFKYVDEELRQTKPSYQIKYYLKKTRSFKELCHFFYDIATARYILLDDYYRPFYNLTFRSGTDIIQMWHAAGAFKKFGYSAVGLSDSNTEAFEHKAHRFYTKAVVTGREVVSKYAEAFNMRKKDVYPIGLPRTDLFFNKEKLEHIKAKYVMKYPQLQDKTIITYAPTFRGGPRERVAFTIQLDLKQMAHQLSDNHVLILKLHPSVTKQGMIPSELKDFVVNLSREDMNDILSITDVLISDYSSVIFEYALLERPMLFFAYDLEQYLGERGFYYDYESFVPGPIVRTTKGIIEAITSQCFDIEKIKDFKLTYFDYLDGCSAQRFVDTFIK